MGRFVMGTDDAEAPDDERPTRNVTVGSLAISPYVTVDQWAAFAEATGYRTIAETEGTSFPSCVAAGDAVSGLDWTGGQDAAPTPANNAPVTHVAWFDVYEFCRWAGVRLPTEAEWAYVASCSQEANGGLGERDDLWEWCDDWYSSDFFRDEQRVNPTGPISGTHRLARGGTSRATQRLAVLADVGASDLSFRVIRR